VIRLVALVVALALSAAPPARAAEPAFQAAAVDIVGADQGVFAHAEDGTVLAALNADRPVHPASVTKVATTLALLRQLGPEHRFETRLLTAGTLRDGTLHGDLVVAAGGDPFFVSENAFLLLLALREVGLRVVEGGLGVRGPLLFNWQPDPAGKRLRRALVGLDGGGAWPAVRAARPDAAGLSPAALALGFAPARRGSRAGESRLLVVHRSPPLGRVVKALNCYSNNVFDRLSDRIGGPGAVQRTARNAVALDLRSAIVIDDAAGAGTANRLSPRAAVALLDALAAELGRHGRSLVDALPVSGIDPGTLHERLAGGVVVGKTGTIGSLGASALAGRVRTRRFGEVSFAVLDRGLPVREAQRRQDAFVRALLDAGEGEAWPYRGDALPSFAEAEVQVAR
jgi:D-alanyl-D-alanine carboxypeptidase/D-alanyl-D-alanine-endopeptidase (penicillin-binding protein 4)